MEKLTALVLVAFFFSAYEFFDWLTGNRRSWKHHLFGALVAVIIFYAFLRYL